MGLNLRIVKSIPDGYPIVMDSQAVGRIYLSPVTFGIFEENAGKTNTSTARLEANGTYGVERPGAVVQVNG